MGTGVLLPLLFLLAQCTDCWYSPGANKLCLSCSHVTDPHSCTHFAEARSNEVCTTERLILLNGSTVWNFGFEDDEGCNENDVRVRRSSEFGYLVCHECCYTDLCNHKLCGSSSDNDLPCLVGEERGRGLHSDDTDIVYCNEGDLCYVGQSTDSRPGQFHYGCASQSLCNQLPSHDVHDTCQRCCNTDGCNAHACDVEVPVTQNPTDVTVNGTATPMLGDDMFLDCWDLHTRGHFNQDGIYDIYPPPDHSRLRVRCDMTSNGGGWIFIQRRYDASVDFNRTFDEYAQGFGEIDGEYWLGLETIHQLTTHGSDMMLRTDVCWQGGWRSNNAPHRQFRIASRGDVYSENWRGRIFRVAGECAERYGAWWHGDQNVCAILGINKGNGTHGLPYRKIGDGPSVIMTLSEVKLRPMIATGNGPRFTCPT